VAGFRFHGHVDTDGTILEAIEVSDSVQLAGWFVRATGNHAQRAASLANL